VISWLIPWSVLVVVLTKYPRKNSSTERFDVCLGQSRMDNLEKLATLGTQDTRRRQTKQNKTTQEVSDTIIRKQTSKRSVEQLYLIYYSILNDQR
jgi:hypothetical protein